MATGFSNSFLHSSTTVGAPAGVRDAATSVVGSPTAPPEHLSGHAGAIAPLSIGSLPSRVAGISRNYYYDYYFRIIMVPLILNLVNPKLDTPIAFAIWNAYPTPNMLESFTLEHQSGSDVSSLTGITTDVQAPLLFGALEYRDSVLSLAPSVPLQFSDKFTAVFAQGQATMLLNVKRAYTFNFVPEIPVKETWEWMTDIQVSSNGKEQRRALRGSPRRSSEFDILVLNPDDYQTQWASLLAATNGLLVTPFFQWAGGITVPVLSGSTEVFCDLSRADVRAGENVLLYARDGSSFLSKVLLLRDTSIVLEDIIGLNFDTSSIVIPMFSCYIANKTKIDISNYYDDKISYSTMVSDTRAEFGRGVTNFTVVDGLVVLDKQPLSSETSDMTFDGGNKLLDYNTGLRTLYTPWSEVRIQQSRSYRLNRVLNPADSDYWRDFLANVAVGQQNSFLVPSFKHDFTLGLPNPAGASFIEVVGTGYLDVFQNNPSLVYISFLSGNGSTHYAKINSVLTGSVEGNSILSFSPSLPVGDTSFTDMARISLMAVSRLGSDKVELSHTALYTTITVVTRSCNR